MPINGRTFTPEHAFTGANGERTPISIKPFTSVDLSDDTEVLNWLETAAKDLSDYYAPYRSLYKENINVYVGGSLRADVQWNGQNLRRSKNNSHTSTAMLRPIIESHVSRLSSSRAHVSVLPTHSGEYNDLSAAKNAEMILQMSFQDRKVDDMFEKASRTMLVCGSAYMLVEWDNSIGPPMPQLQEGVPVVDENNEPRMDEDGKPIMIHGDIRIGDVGYRVLRPDQVLEQPGRWGDNVDWVIQLDMVDLYRLKEKFPTVAHEIKPVESSVLDSISIKKTAESQALVYTLYHRATPTFPNGRILVCTPDVVLENTDLPYPTLNKYGKLPITRVEDMCVPGYDLPLPLTVMEAGKPYQLLHNRVNQNIVRNLSLQTPKWMVHSGSGVRLPHLNNSSNIVQYKGDASMAPRMDSPPTTPAEIFNYRTTLAQDMQVVTGSSHTLNAPPPNTRAAAMLEHQEEQEFKRAEPLIKHMNNFQAETAQIALAIMADKYDDSDERVVRLMGHRGSAAFLRLQTADLMGPFDIKFERTSALPESKQGRLNEAARLFQTGLIDKSLYQKLIGFNADPEMATAETKAYEKQLLENDLLVRGHQVQPPVEFEDHVEHLKALYPLLQSVEFSEMPPPIKQNIINHINAHEMYAWKRSQISVAYAIRVAEHVQFAIFSALPEAMPVGVNNPPTPVEGAIQERLTTPGLVAPSRGLIEPPGPGNPEAV